MTWVNIVTVNVKKVCSLDLFCSGLVPIVGCCQEGSERSISVKNKKYLVRCSSVSLEGKNIS